MVLGRDWQVPDEIAAATRTAAAESDVWAKYRFEYDCPVAWMALTPDTVWTLDFSLTNRGDSVESFSILLTEFHFAEDQPSFVSPDTPARPGRIFLTNWSFVILGGEDFRGQWPRIYTSSPNLVPSIHFYVDAPDGAYPDAAPSHPDVYFGRGDFQVFDVVTGFMPPKIGPAI